MSTIYDWHKDGVTMIPNALINNFSKLNISSDEMIFIIYLLCQLSVGNQEDEISQVMNQLGWPQSKLFEIINSLMQKKYLSIELKPNKDGKQTDHYTLRPLFEMIDDKFYENKKAVKTQSTNSSNTIIIDFEQEFGRTLSPIELEKISGWVNKDKFDVNVIRIALRQAVINQALNFNYIDRILINWDKKGLKTVEQVEKDINNFQNRYQSTNNNSINQKFDNVKIPIVDWLNESDY